MKLAGDQRFMVQEISLKIFEQIVTVAYLKEQLTEVYCRKRVLKNFTNFTEKHLCCSLFLIKLQG